MAPKRSSHLDDPPAASSSEEEEEASSEEEASESEEDDEQESQKLKTNSVSSPTNATTATTAATEKKNPSKKADSSSGSESDGDSSSDSEPGDASVKPIASKPMEETPKTKKPRSRAATATTSARPSAKRPSESEVKDSKRAKKGSEQPDGVLTQVEDESKKSGDDSKKLFQRLWSEDDEIVILKGMIDYTAKKGADPFADMNGFYDFIKKSLQIDFTKNQLSDKLRRLKKKYENNAGKKKFNPTKPHDEKVFELSKKIWGGEGGGLKSEQPKANGSTARSSQKGNSKTLASLKAELLSSAEALKDVEKIDINRDGDSSGRLIGFDKSFGALGLPEHIVKKGLDSISELKKAEFHAKWEKIHIAELELFAKRTQLLSDQAKLIAEALKSAHH